MGSEKIHYSWKIITAFFVSILIISSLILYIEVYKDSAQKESLHLGKWKYCEGQLLSNNCNQPDSKWKTVDIMTKKEFKDDTNYVEFKRDITPSELMENSILFSVSEQKVHIYLNDIMIFSNGEFNDEDLIGGLRWKYVEFPRTAELLSKNTLTIQMYSPKKSRLGNFNYFFIDKEHKNIQKIFLFDVLNISSLAITFVLFIIMSLFYFKEKDHKTTYLASLSFLSCFMLWLMCTLNIKYLLIPDNRYWWIALNFFAYSLPIFANYIIYTVLSEKKNKQKLLAVMGSYGLLELSAILGELLGYNTINSLMGILYSVLIFFEAYVLYLTYKEVQNENHYAKALLICIIVFPIMGVIDGLGVHFQLYHAKFFLFPLSIYSFFIFALSLMNEQLKKNLSIHEQTVDLKIDINTIIKESNRDRLTKCLNRESFDQTFEECCIASANTNRPFCIVMLDIDKFKRFNDRYGHDDGDKVLINFANTVRKYLPGKPPFFRWGGEEFIILMPYLDITLASYLAECIRKGIEKANIHRMEKVTASIGVAEWHFEKDSKHKIAQRVDEALYYAKRNGRNRVVTENMIEKLKESSW